MKRVLVVCVSLCVGLAVGFWVGSNFAVPWGIAAWSFSTGAWSQGRPADTIARILSEYPELLLEARGTVQVSSRTVRLQVALQSPDLSADDAFEAKAVVEGPWDRPAMRLESLKKKEFRAKIGI